jgi:hypothetical protein
MNERIGRARSAWCMMKREAAVASVNKSVKSIITSVQSGQIMMMIGFISW